MAPCGAKCFFDVFDVKWRWWGSNPRNLLRARQALYQLSYTPIDINTYTLIYSKSMSTAWITTFPFTKCTNGLPFQPTFCRKSAFTNSSMVSM